VRRALCSGRPYKSAWTPEQAIAEIRRVSGTQFDPRVVTAFPEHPRTRHRTFALVAAAPGRWRTRPVARRRVPGT